MFRGTTPTIRWKLSNESIDLSTVEQIWMTFKEQNNEKSAMTKDITELTIDEEKRTISYDFSQEETLQFKTGIIETQLRVLLDNGDALATEIQTFKVERILKGGVIE